VVGSAGPLCTLWKQVSWCLPQTKKLLSNSVWELRHSHSIIVSRDSPMVRHIGEHWASVHCRLQASWHLQSSRLLVCEEAGIPALRGDGTLLQASVVRIVELQCTLGK
jgi:hypothetical protein